MAEAQAHYTLNDFNKVLEVTADTSEFEDPGYVMRGLRASSLLCLQRFREAKHESAEVV